MFVILFVMYVWTLMSLKLLIKIKQLLKLDDYYKISLETFGTFGGWITKLCLLMNNLGVSTAYLIIYLNSCE